MVPVRRQRRLRSMILCWGLSLSKLPKDGDGTVGPSPTSRRRCRNAGYHQIGTGLHVYVNVL